MGLFGVVLNLGNLMKIILAGIWVGFLGEMGFVDLIGAGFRISVARGPQTGSPYARESNPRKMILARIARPRRRDAARPERRPRSRLFLAKIL